MGGEMGDVGGDGGKGVKFGSGEEGGSLIIVS